MYNFNDAFKYRIEASVEEIQQIAAILTAQRPGVPNGSSFAVTSDARHGQRHLWLSEVSYQTLIGMNIIPDMFQAKTSERI